MRTTINNLETAKPRFMFYLKNINPELGRFIQYVGLNKDFKNEIIFQFKTSTYGLSFEIYAGLHDDELEFLIHNDFNSIYDYFKKLKYDFYGYQYKV